jgi:hypothetical protein
MTRQKGFSPIIIFILVALVVMGYIGYNYFTNNFVRLTERGGPTPPLNTSNPTATPETLVWGIKINVCCSCPTKIPVSRIGKGGWIPYEKGVNYAKFLPEDCQKVVCKPCSSPEENNQPCGGIQGKECPVGSICHYEGNYPDASGICVEIPPATTKPCVYKGKTYSSGEIFKDKCNSCTCENGQTGCTLIACP